MPNMSGLIMRQTVNAEEIAAIEQLIAVCNAYEHLKMRVFIRMLQERPGTSTNDFLYYDDDGSLIGYLCLTTWGEVEKELMAIVDPAHRRKGIFRLLLEKARQEFVAEGGKYFTIVCERTSQSGAATMKAMRIALNFSEHEMHLGTFKAKNTFDDRLTFRQATTGDVDAVAKILMEDDVSEESAHAIVARWLQDGKNRIYLATLGGQDLGCDEPVGTLRLEDMGRANELGIYGFVVRPDYRGKGYGRQMLEECIRIARANGPVDVMLDVDASNTRAFNLYHSAGFEIKTTYDYYHFEVL